MYSDVDHRMMSLALSLSQRGRHSTTPNPHVGCVIARDERILGEGWTQPPGSNHAEVEALLDARKNGHDVHGATAYVTLEPCSHFGRTPPCATALIEARIGRVIAAVEDPHPRVAGGGLTMLRTSGIEVRCGLLQSEAIEENIGFFSRMNRGRPWVRLKVAASIDGKTALQNGVSQWITSEAARTDAHAWRARACAVLTGIGTVRADDPQLNVRLVATERQPLKVLVDSQMDVPAQARLFDGTPVLLACAHLNEAKRNELADRNVQVVVLPDAHGKVDLAALMRELGERGINDLLVEGGFKLNGSLVHAALVDEMLIYLAPMLIGEATGMLHLPALSDLGQARRLSFRDVAPVGEDVRVLARLNEL